MGERQFLELCREILKNGVDEKDRTGTGIRYLFSPQNITYDLTGGKVPFFTTKKIAWRTTIIELLWFISGSSDSNELLKNGCNWWTGNTTREFLDSRGLSHLPVGNVGKMYGYQWRKCSNSNKSVDQLARLITNIKAVKNGDYTQSRRLMMSSYIPTDLEDAVLEPCHTFVQFNVEGEYLDSVLYQRSGDMFLGVQINIPSYSVLTHMIADVCGLKARRFIHHLGNAHIYHNHIEQMNVQLSRTPRESPIIHIIHRENIDDYTIGDFTLENYNPDAFIKAPMAV